MRYLTLDGRIANLDEQDLVEARVSLGDSYQPSGSRTIVLRDGSSLVVELFEIPAKDLGGLTAKSPIFWRGSHGNGHLLGVDVEKLHGQVNDIRLLTLAVRHAFEAARKSNVGASRMQLMISTLTDVFTCLGWKFSSADLMLDDNRNMHYLKRNGVSSGNLKGAYAQLASSINDAKHDVTRAREADLGLRGWRLKQLDTYRLASCDLRPITVEDITNGTRTSFRVFNHEMDLNVTVLTTEERQSHVLFIYMSSNATLRPLSLSVISAAMKAAS